MVAVCKILVNRDQVLILKRVFISVFDILYTV